MIPVFDLHCDLLFYLQSKKNRSIHDPLSRCSAPQMLKGGVKVQVLPIFAGSRKDGEEQMAIFQSLKAPFEILASIEPINLSSAKIYVMPAIENASSLCAEDDSLQILFKLLEKMKFAYISLTWNFENRFGGGAYTSIGLKEDGKRLLEWLDGKKMAVDLSHASDKLCEDILNTIKHQKWDIPLIASHSNCRSIRNEVRNLPDELIKEIITQDGLIGLNAIRYFVTDGSKEKFTDHILHLIDLGGRDNMALGLDFFNEADVDLPHRKSEEVLFFPEFSNSSCYPELLKLCPAEYVENLSYLNAVRFAKKRL